MQWILVYVSLTFHGHPMAEELGRYDSMTDCFANRQEQLYRLGSTTGFPPAGTQLVCIRMPDQGILQ